MRVFADLLKRSPITYLLGREIKRTREAVGEELRRRRWRRDRQSTISAYLASTKEPKLQVGCGPMNFEGWLNSDLEPEISRNVIFIDISEELPFPDSSLQFIYSEHVVEHVSLEAALTHFKESFRVLRPGGVARIALPDLRFLLDYFEGQELSDLQRTFLKDTLDKFHPSLPIRTPSMLLNDFVRRWGHQFIYDRNLLVALLQFAGFHLISHCEVGSSKHAALNQLESHGSAISDEYNRLQTMVIEATKPVC